MDRTRTTLSALAAAALVMVLVAPAGADDLFSRQQSTHQKRQDVDRKLDLARVSDVQVEAEANRLSKAVAAQSAKVESAQQSQSAAEAELAASTARFEAVEARVKRVRSALESRAIYAYLHPGPSLFQDIAKSASLSEAGRRLALLDFVQSSEKATLDRYRSARADLASARSALEAAKNRAQSRAQGEADARDKLMAAEKAKEAAHAELANRIATLQHESAALAATEGNIQNILASRASSNAAVLGSLSVKPSAGGFIWPAHGPVMSEYGPRWDMFHTGIDIGVFSGTPIQVAKTGVVSYAGWMDGGWGNIVIVDHGGGFATAYAHQSRITSSVGQVLQQGQVLGYSGCTGYCSGDHLHFEIRVNGTAQNPRLYESGSP